MIRYNWSYTYYKIAYVSRAQLHIFFTVNLSSPQWTYRCLLLSLLPPLRTSFQSTTATIGFSRRHRCRWVIYLAVIFLFTLCCRRGSFSILVTVLGSTTVPPSIVPPWSLPMTVHLRFLLIFDFIWNIEIFLWDSTIGFNATDLECIKGLAHDCVHMILALDIL